MRGFGRGLALLLAAALCVASGYAFFNVHVISFMAITLIAGGDVPGWTQVHYQLVPAAIAAGALGTVFAALTCLGAPPGSRVSRHIIVWMTFIAGFIASAPWIAVSDALFIAVPLVSGLAIVTALLWGRP